MTRMETPTIIVPLLCLLLLSLNEASNDTTTKASSRNGDDSTPREIPTHTSAAVNEETSHSPSTIDTSDDSTNVTLITAITPINQTANSTSNSSLVLPKSVKNILQQITAMLPQNVRDAVLNSGINFNSSQLKTVYDFVQSLLKKATTNTSSLNEILQSIQTSGLLKSLLKSIGSGATAPGMVHSKNWATCQQNVQTMLQGVVKRENWALQMIDATGKPDAGIMEGNLKLKSNFKECKETFHVDITDRANPSLIEGNVCTARIAIPGVSQIVQAVAAPKLEWELCLPKSCLQEDLNMALMEFSLTGVVSVVCTKDMEISEDLAAMLAILVLLLFGVLMVTGTLMGLCIKSKHKRRHVKNSYIIDAYNGNINTAYDSDEPKHTEIVTTSFTEPSKLNETTATARSTRNKNGNKDLNETNDKSTKNIPAPPFQGNDNTDTIPEENNNENSRFDEGSLPSWQRALLAFSIPRNTEKILSVKSSPGTIGCLHGIRVLSMGWVILGHTITYSALLGRIKNTVDVVALTSTISFQLVINAVLAVDTFFVMSGALTSYLFLKTLGKKKKITIKELVLYYIHRYWRLTPSLMIWIMVVACIMKYIGDGRAGWTDFQGAQVCRDWWWANLLYINNFFMTNNEACVGVTWYLACDMQYYFVAPLALIPWVYGKKFLGFLSAIILIGVHLASNIILQLDVNGDMIHNQVGFLKDIYFKPYTRVAPFAIGLMLGWLLWRTNCKVKMHKSLLLLGWVACIGLILVFSLASYDENKAFPLDPWTKTVRAIYETVNRPGWALAISWLIFACATGHGGYINSLLSWKGWLPLSRLTYSAYLIHLTIITFEASSAESTILFTATSAVYEFFGYFVMAYVVGYLLTIAVESPMLGLEKVLFRR